LVAARLPLADDPLGDENAMDGSGSAPAQPKCGRTLAARHVARPLRVPWSEGVQQSVRQAFHLLLKCGPMWSQAARGPGNEYCLNGAASENVIGAGN